MRVLSCLCAALTLSAVCTASTPDASVSVRGWEERSAPLSPVNGGCTVSVLVKPEVGLGATWWHQRGIVFAYGNGYNEGFRLVLAPDQGRYYPQVEFGQAKGGALLVRNRAVLLEPGRWYRLTMSCDGREVRLYADGARIAVEAQKDPLVLPRERTVRFFSDGAQYGIATRPVMASAASVWTRVLSDDEIGKLDRTAFEPDTPEFPEFFARTARGERLPAGEVEAWTNAHALSPAGRDQLDRVLAVSHLVDGRYDLAKAAFDRASQWMEKEKAPALDRTEFRESFLSALEDLGLFDRAIALLKEDILAAKGRHDPCLAYMKLRLLKVLERAGRTADAARMRESLLREDLTSFPHLRAALGQRYEWPAGPEAGARVSRREPREEMVVAPAGDDSNPGTKARPLASLARAVSLLDERIRRKGLPKGGVAIRLRGGHYRMTEPVKLPAGLSGTRENPIVISAWKDEIPVLDGGFSIPSLTPVADKKILARLPAVARGRVMVCDLKAAGYPQADDTRVRCGWFTASAVPVIELYEDGERLEPSRYPDDTFLRITKVGEPVNAQLWCDQLPADMPWTEEKALHGFGYWGNNWADLTSTVTKIVPETGEIVIDPDIPNRNHSHERGNVGQCFYLLNAVCALNRPGEWCIEEGRLYVWPKRPRKGADGTGLSLASLEGPILGASGTHDIRIENLVFEGTRRVCVEVRDSHDVLVAGNVVRNTGGNGLVARGCTDCTLEDNVFHTFGHGAVEVFGGDRKTLVHARNRITNNEIADIGFRRHAQAPHLLIGGVGTEVSYNHLSGAPCSTLRLEGNDLYIVSNLVEKVVQEADDQGGVDIYFRACYWGNRYCWNVWKDVGHDAGIALKCGQAAIRFDGNISGQTVFANRFIRCGTSHFGAIQSCGGRLHVIDNNLFVDCNFGMSISDYPLDFWVNKIRPRLVRPCLEEVCITNAPYANRYPGIATLLETNQLNRLVRNVTVGGAPLLVRPPKDTSFYWNRRYAAVPEYARLQRELGFERVPDESEVGPRATARFERARRNDRMTMGDWK